jgi:hypothetical protein
MLPERDPWASGGDATRREVREIFARHAQQADAAGAAGRGPERRAAVPGLLRLPSRLWQLLPHWGRLAAGALAVALAAAVAVLLPPALENAAENRENERRASAANRAEIRRGLVESQRPRRAVLPRPVTAGAVAAAVDADFEQRVRDGDLEGPGGRTTCRPVRPQPDPVAIVFTCMAETGTERGRYLDRELVSGYRFRARVVRATGAAAWCKENPRPLHGDQEEFIVVPVSRACTG